MYHNPTKQDTYSDVAQIIDGDFTVPSINCEKAVVW